MWKIVYSKQAVKDSNKIIKSNLQNKVKHLIHVLEKDSFQAPPPYEKLIGDLSGAYSRRVTLQYRLVYQVFPDEKVVRILRMWTQYEL